MARKGSSIGHDSLVHFIACSCSNRSSCDSRSFGIQGSSCKLLDLEDCSWSCFCSCSCRIRCRSFLPEHGSVGSLSLVSGNHNSIKNANQVKSFSDHSEIIPHLSAACLSSCSAMSFGFRMSGRLWGYTQNKHTVLSGYSDTLWNLNFSRTVAGITKWFGVTIEGYLSYLLPKFEDLVSTSLGSGAI